VVVRLACPTNLEGALDTTALLRDDQAPDPPYWMHLWPGSVTLARRLASRPTLGGRWRVLELGCGLGLPALIAACRGARVIATDRLRAPLLMLGMSAAATGVRVERVQMEWGVPALAARVDLCLGADIAYALEEEPALAATMTELVSPGGRVWLADSVNTTRRTLLDRLRDHGFAVRVTHRPESDEGRRVWVRLIEAQRR
jgi:predicted nicotinamide N-methyase